MIGKMTPLWRLAFQPLSAQCRGILEALKPGTLPGIKAWERGNNAAMIWGMVTVSAGVGAACGSAGFTQKLSLCIKTQNLK